MSEEKKEEKEEEEKEKEAKRVVKVSDLLSKAGMNPEKAVGLHDLAPKQIENLIELYTVVSKSILELVNDVRDLRKRSENFDGILVQFQKGLNKGLGDLHLRTSNLEKEIQSLTELWNSAVNEAEGFKDATDKEREENQEGNGEDLRKAEG